MFKPLKVISPVVNVSILTLTLHFAALETVAQDPLKFDVAAVKLSGAVPPARSGGPGTDNPGQYSDSAISFRDLVSKAFGVLPDLVSGPDWIRRQRYSLQVQMPPTTTQAQFQIMLQNLLVERFALRARREPIVRSVYELRIGPKGHKLQAAVLPNQENATARDSRGGPVDKDGFPTFTPGTRSPLYRQETGSAGEILQYWVFPNMSTGVLADYMAPFTGRYVLDKTGVEGSYDVSLKFEPRVQAPGVLNTLSIFDAVADQLGLQLVDAKAPIDQIVIDSANSDPTEN